MIKRVLILLALLIPLCMFSQRQISYGKASFYADKFEGRTTASGEKYWHSKHTAAHKTLPFNSQLKVTNLSNNKTVVVRINDRGPFVKDRIIDLSKSAAKQLDFVKEGVCDVKIEVISEGEPQKESLQPAVREVGSGVIKNAQGKTHTITPQFYALNVKTTKPAGYGVQLASYKEMVNLLERTESIQSTLNETVNVQVSSVNGEKVYRIIVGQFDNRPKAERYKESIMTNFPGCFIFKY